MSELTLVTSYFDIGRKQWKGFANGNEKYISNFAHWARMKNKLIVYTSPDIAPKVEEIRASYGLADKTIVIPVQDITTLAPELYQATKQAMQNKQSWTFHRKLGNPESWNYRYNYIMELKSYWIQDAIHRGLADGMIAWIDFGYDHGGDYFYSEDFDFCWSYDFEPLIHVFLENPLDDTPIFRIVQSMKVYIRGNLLIAPAQLWLVFWEEIQHAVFSLAECGLADDDQTLMVMAYRRRPELFYPHATADWGEGLYAYGGDKLKIREQKKKKSPWLHTLGHTVKSNLRQKYEEWDIHRRKGSDIEKKYFSK